MAAEKRTINLRRLIADDGMVITDKETQTMRVKEIYLAKGERKDSFIEIDENTYLPEPADKPISESEGV